jgi:GNAT superfamily N-acetyltransferase
VSEFTKIVIRDAVAEDKNFILSTWLKGNYYGSLYFRQVPEAIYYKEYADHILRILFTPGVQISVACDETNPSWIVGFCAWKDDVLYWIFVKRDFRERGIATLLVEGKQIKTVKAVTKVGRAIAERKGLIFNPF